MAQWRICLVSDDGIPYKTKIAQVDDEENGHLALDSTVEALTKLMIHWNERTIFEEKTIEAEGEAKSKCYVDPALPKRKALTTQIHAAYRPISTVKGTRLFEKKKEAEARLNCFKTRLRNDMIEKARKRHFRKADTVAFDSQFSDAGSPQASSQDAPCAKPISYHLPERAAVVRLTCEPADGLTEQGKLTRRIRAIEARAALCHRLESCRRRRPQPHVKREEQDASSEDSTKDSTGEKNDRFPLVYKPTQCIFCLGNKRKPYQERNYEYAKPDEMMNEVEEHLRQLAPEDSVLCPHLTCKAAISRLRA